MLLAGLLLLTCLALLYSHAPGQSDLDNPSVEISFSDDDANCVELTVKPKEDTNISAFCPSYFICFFIFLYNIIYSSFLENKFVVNCPPVPFIPK